MRMVTGIIMESVNAYVAKFRRVFAPSLTVRKG